MSRSGSRRTMSDRKKDKEEEEREYHSSDSSDSNDSIDTNDSEYDSVFDMSQDSEDSEDDSENDGETKDEHKINICKITNEDIAQAFALFDFRLRQIAKKVGAEMSPIPDMGVIDEGGNNEQKQDREVEEEGSKQVLLPMVFPYVPVSMEGDDDDQKLPPVFRNVRFGKS